MQGWSDAMRWWSDAIPKRVAYFIIPAPRVGHAQPQLPQNTSCFTFLNKPHASFRGSHIASLGGQECNTSTQLPSSLIDITGSTHLSHVCCTHQRPTHHTSLHCPGPSPPRHTALHHPFLATSPFLPGPCTVHVLVRQSRRHCTRKECVPV